MLELLSELLFIVYQYYYYYFSFFSSLNKRFPSIIKQAGLIFLYNCNYNNCYCNCECLVYIDSLVAFNVYTLKNDKKNDKWKKIIINWVGQIELFFKQTNKQTNKQKKTG